MSELFEIQETLSPRLAWIVENEVMTHHAPHCPEAPWMAIIPMEDDKGMSIGDIMAESCMIYDDAGLIGYGMNETDAIVDMAKKMNLKLWNENGLAR